MENKNFIWDQSTWHHILDYSNLYSQCCKNLKSLSKMEDTTGTVYEMIDLILGCGHRVWSWALVIIMMSLGAITFIFLSAEQLLPCQVNPLTVKLVSYLT